MATYPFVQSYHDYGLRGTKPIPIRGITVHMAEGGGTVGYLSRANPNKVSVHYVIEYSGRVVQMLLESHVNGTINPRDIRTTNDPAYTFNGERIVYGVTAAKAALGIWWEDPNRATIGIEIEGFAATGPNKAQAASLVKLIADIRSRHPQAHNLGHRDFADYKACPGKRIDWPALGGHGAASGAPADEDEVMLDGWPLPGGDGTVTLKEKRGLFHPFTGETIIPDDRVKTSYCRWHLKEPDKGDPDRQEGYLVRHAGKPWIAFYEAVDFEPASAPASAPEPQPYTVIVGGKEVGSVTLP